jgi:hypothetical protein
VVGWYLWVYSRDDVPVEKDTEPEKDWNGTKGIPEVSAYLNV